MLHDERHLPLLRSAVAHHRRLHLCRRILPHGATPAPEHRQRGAPDLRQRQAGAWVPGGKRRLQHHHIGPVAGQQLLQLVLKVLQGGGAPKRAGQCDAAVGDELKPRRTAVHHAPPGQSGTRVEAKDSQRRADLAAAITPAAPRSDARKDPRPTPSPPPSAARRIRSLAISRNHQLAWRSLASISKFAQTFCTSS